MKLVIQIPCHNEEVTLPVTLRDLPKKIDGIDSIEVLVIDDGSTDDTVNVAKRENVKHILRLAHRSGLAEAFRRGLEKSLELGADIIVNTDGDNQYKGGDVPKLIRPILDGNAAIVVGCRDIMAIKHFSFLKKMLQLFGSHMVRKFSKTDIPDTTSGFRAYSKEAALKINVFSSYTYTLETIIQAGLKGIPMAYINTTTNQKLRESRLIKNVFSYITRSISTMIRVYLMYEPMKFFVRIGSIILLAGVVLDLRYLYFFLFTAKKSGHVQSLMLGMMLFITGFMVITIGLLGDIVAANRKLNEEILYRLRRRDAENGKR